MKIRNIEVEFNFLDADDMERLETEAKKVQEECYRKEKQEMSTSQAIREECKIINEFFDNVFGKGISDKLFNGKSNLMEHIKTFEDIMREAASSRQDLQNTYDRYQPNREQRRYNEFHRRNRR